MSYLLRKIKSFFNNIFKNKKLLNEMKNDIIEKKDDSFHESIANLVNTNGAEAEIIIEKIKSGELNLQDKTADEIREIKNMLNEYLEEIKLKNKRKEEEILMYKQKISNQNN